MIALAVSHANVPATAYEAGIHEYVQRRGSSRWNDFVIIPQPWLRPGGLRAYRLTGLIAFLSGATSVEEARSLGIPVVNLSASREGAAFPTITTDSQGVGITAANYFLARGYRHFAYVTHARPLAFASERGIGFVKALEASATTIAWYGAAPADLPSVVRREGTESIAAWLKRLPKPVAVFAAQDVLAAQVRLAAQAARLSVPQQVSILGVDNDPTIREQAGDISTICPPRKQVGYEAAAMLDRLMDGKPLRTRVVAVPPGEIITRGSSDARAIDDDIVLDVLRLIDERSRDRLDVGAVVSTIPLSRRAIERRFARVTGMTIKARIQQTRLASARRLLTSTTMSIDEIAAACGFSDRNRFFIAFRTATGEAPSRYRAARRAVVDAEE